MSLHRRVSYNDIKDWSTNSGMLRDRIKNNDLLVVTSDKSDEVKILLDKEQIHYTTIGNSIFKLKPTNLNVWNKEQNSAFLEGILNGITNRIASYKDGKLFVGNPTALLNDIDYGLNTQFITEFRSQLSEKFPDLLTNFDNSVETLKDSIQ
jgi:hypothetical protein